MVKYIIMGGTTVGSISIAAAHVAGVKASTGLDSTTCTKSELVAST